MITPMVMVMVLALVFLNDGFSFFVGKKKIIVTEKIFET